MELEFKDAVRTSAPMLIGLPGVSGSGKTYSAILLAAGLAGPDGTVGFVDTENGRGNLYADSPGIRKALPNGYKIVQLNPPFSPERYIAAMEAAERAGITVLVLDSVSHEWEGIGGCCEIAETNKLRGMPNWAMAKRLHKRFLNKCLCSNMHLIMCLRARDKVKIVKDGAGKDQFVQMGIQPVTEKNFVFEMLLSLQLDEGTHLAKPIKVPEQFTDMFPASGKLITKEDGDRIREWNSGALPLNPAEQLKKLARVTAEDGKAAYQQFFTALTPAQKRMLAGAAHEENKYIAEQADIARAQESDEQPALAEAS